jgi:RNA-directed DNA polymerase
LETTKSFDISKQLVWDAYKRVAKNKGAAGVDNQSLEDFDADLENNLYRLWNKMASGSYFPPPVKRVDIPKSDGKTRPLGILTVSDRIAQMVVKLKLEPVLEPHFDEDSYGYRPNKSALDAVGKARERCWRSDWVVDIDIQGFFDNIDHQLLMKAIKKHTDCRWVILYIGRWLTAPVILPDGQKIESNKGTPQGGVVSPLLANLFLHYALDRWVKQKYPAVTFERYADDVIYHCKTRYMAEQLLASIRERLEACKLKLHPEKSKIVYCKDNTRKGDYQHVQFDFLGYSFRPRLVKARKGNFFVSFTPAISKKARSRISDSIRDWKIHLWSDQSLETISSILNPKIRGWFNYYGKYQKSAVYGVGRQIDFALVRWAKRKYKKLKPSYRKATGWVAGVKKRQPNLFAHWNIAK